MNPETAEQTIERFEAALVGPGEFSHHAHVRLAWSYLQRYPLLEAATRFSEALRAFTRRVGAEAKYHETITLAFVLLIADRMHSEESWSEFECNNAALFENGIGALSAYYSPTVLGDVASRSGFVWPDRRPG